MRIEGVIKPGSDGPAFSREAWCELISRRPEFRPPASRQIRNPFSSEPLTILPPKDAAEVVLEYEPVGYAYWSMSEEALVNVAIEPAAMSLVGEWAAELGGMFHEEPWRMEADA